MYFIISLLPTHSRSTPLSPIPYSTLSLPPPSLHPTYTVPKFLAVWPSSVTWSTYKGLPLKENDSSSLSRLSMTFFSWGGTSCSPPLSKLGFCVASVCVSLVSLYVYLPCSVCRVAMFNHATTTVTLCGWKRLFPCGCLWPLDLRTFPS